MYSMMTTVDNTVWNIFFFLFVFFVLFSFFFFPFFGMEYFKVAKRLDLRILSQEKKIITV